MIKDTTGIILSGGKSERMGANKALLKIGDQTIIEIIYARMKSLFANVIVISNEPDLYQFLEAPIYKDIYPGKGPMSGIHSGLANSVTERNFFVSCDLPLVKIELIEYILSIKTDKSATIPSEGNYIQTLCAVYEKSCFPFFDERLKRKETDTDGKSNKKQKQFSILNLIAEIGAEIIDVTALPFYDDKLFFNLNNMTDFESLKKIIERQNENM